MNYDKVLNEKFYTPFTKADRLLMKKAESLYKDNKLNDALLIYKSLRESYPLSISLILITGEIYWTLNKIDYAIDFFRKAVELEPKSEKISRALMHVLWEKNNEFAAVEEIQRFMKVGKPSKEYIDIAHEINFKRNLKIFIPKIHDG